MPESMPDSPARPASSPAKPPSVARQRAAVAAALAAAAALGYTGHKIQIDARYQGALPVNAAEWDCSKQLPDGTPLCSPRAATAPAGLPDAWACRHLTATPHREQNCPDDLCEPVFGTVADAGSGAAAGVSAAAPHPVPAAAGARHRPATPHRDRRP